MAKFFVCSDIHSAYTPWMKALNEAGFDENNPEHKIIVCGDLFDRMDESVEVLHFVMKMANKDKIILVKGNHDILLEECCMRGFPYRYDTSNGTKKTIQDIGGKQSIYDFTDACDITWNKLARYRELLVNYFETKNYIFVHSWIPTSKTSVNNLVETWIPITTYGYMEDWRNANDVEWEDAMWGNPFNMWQDGLNKTGKTIVFGHWHCSTGHSMASGGEFSEFGEDACWEPFIHDNIIGIDRCTAHTGEVNVIVLEDEFLEG